MRRWWAAAALSLTAAACTSGGETTAPVVPQKLGATAAQATAPSVADANHQVPFSYSPIGKRDPFRSYLLELEEQSSSTGTGRPKEATEMFETDQYQLTAVITGTKSPKAMLEDPTGRGHVVHMGSRLGRHGGRVTRIADGMIEIIEQTLDAAGRPLRVPIQIHLPRPDVEDGSKR